MQQRSKSNDDSSSTRPPNDERTPGQRNLQRSPGHVEDDAKSDQRPIREGGLLDLSKRESHDASESLTRTNKADTQFVVLDDDAEDNGESLQQNEPAESQEESSATSAQSSGSNTSSYYKCTMCDKIFFSYQRHMMHRNKHMGVKPFACPICPANFNTMASLQRHRRSHKTSSANIPTHTCTQCHAQFSNIQHLTEHMKIHSEKKRSCLHCGIFIGGLRSLQKHMAAEHPFVSKPTKKCRPPGAQGRGNVHHAGSKKYMTLSSVSGSQSVTCRHCGRQFQTTRALQGHMKGHSKLYQWNPRRCNCGILLADQAEYQRHLKNSQCSLEPIQQPLSSPGTLSPVSPVNISQAMAFPASRQMDVRSRSLDSALRSPSYPVPYVPVNSSVAYAETTASNPLPAPVTVRDVELRSLAHPSDIDNESSVSKDTVSSMTMSEQSSQSPMDRVTIKTEEWSVVDAQVANDSFEGSGMSHRTDRSELRREQLPLSAFPAQMKGPFQERMAEEQVGNLLYRERPHESGGHMEATSSSQRVRRLEPSGLNPSSRLSNTRNEDVPRRLEPSGSSLERASSESPSTLISSSQSGHPMQNPRASPMQTAPRDVDRSPWRCSYCGVTFEDSLMYVIHRGCHDPISPFKCSMCGEQCADKVTFLLHFVRGHHTKPTHV